MAERPYYQPSTYDRDWAWYPWRKYDEGVPDRSTIFRWRQLAQKLAKRNAGVDAACDLCFRPLRWAGELMWRLPGRAPKRELTACRECLEIVAGLVRQLTVDPPYRESEAPYPDEHGRYEVLQRAEDRHDGE